ncbi:TetR/AcrR family transcriptional regulator [Desulfobacterales bacterium HSG17]|nr:TetR/AcrR family transcriptional regulator [Desulfobacterales bacterium HSG17]
MPPKVKFKKEAIVEAAFNVVRKSGWKGLSARSIAEELNSSTRPIYTHLKSMKDLEKEVFKKAMDLLEKFMLTPRTGDKWVDQGYGFVLFAKREKVLFRALLDEKYGHLYNIKATELFWKHGKHLTDYPLFKGLPEVRTDNLRKIRSTFTHGMAAMLASHSDYYEVEKEEDLATLIDLTNEVLVLGLRAKIEREKSEKNYITSTKK